MPYNQFYNPAMTGYQPSMYQPPMQDRLAQLQNQYQSVVPQMYNQMPQAVQQPQSMVPQQLPMVGRYVNDFSEVTANDVPMDGRSAVFVKADMSEIQTRAWSADGKIVPVVFRPVPIEQEPQHKPEEKITIGLSEENVQAFMKRFDDINDRLDKMEKSMLAKASASKTKKEADAE